MKGVPPGDYALLCDAVGYTGEPPLRMWPISMVRCPLAQRRKVEQFEASASAWRARHR